MTEPVAQLNTALEGRYVVEKEIGRGGMATVYLARDLRHDRLVALKLLSPELGAVLGVERFLSEIKVTANLQHPHLLPLFDSGEAGGLLFYVMPFVDGESLRARLDREKQLPTEDAIGIAVAVASALEYAHQQGVIHRDLKPENILLQAGQAVVADFGIALAVSNAGGARVTQTGISLGTPQYMSPEQATGDRVIDRRSDIYSLAALTYEMLTGEPPHTGSTMQAIIARVLTDRPRSVRATRPNLPEYVEVAIDRALEKLPADRWNSAREFSEALQGKGSGDATRGTASRFAPATARTGWRSRLRDPVVLGLGVVAIAGAAFGAWQWRTASAVGEPPTVRFTLARPRVVRGWTSSTQDTKIAISADGRLLAFVGIAEGGVARIFVRPLDDHGVRAVAGTDGATLVFFSPDGKWIGFAAGGNLMKVPVEGGTPFPLAPVVPGTLTGASWSSSGVIAIGNRTYIDMVPEGGGPTRRLTDLVAQNPNVAESQPLALDDGKTVIFARWTTSGAASARIAIASLETRKTTVLDLPGIAPLGIMDGRLVYATAGGVIMAVPFDVAAARITGPPVTVQTDVTVNVLSGAAQASLSRNGTLAFQSGSLISQLVEVDARGTARPMRLEPGTYMYPRFSPDGRKIAVGVGAGNRSDVWVFDIASSTPTRLTTAGTVNERPEWSPDGRRVLYRSDADGGSSIWWRPADLSAPPGRLLSHPRAAYFEGVLTPDGRTIVYQSDTSGADVYYQALAGDTTPKPIAAGLQFVEDMARVSPDGRWVTFVTDESGAQQVVVQPFPGPGARTQVSTGGGVEPVWSRDGRRLFYRSDQRLIAATLRTDPVFAVTARDTLFEDRFLGFTLPHANFDVAPDGAHFLFLKAAQEAEFQVVVNWRAVLRDRVAGKGTAR